MRSMILSPNHATFDLSWGGHIAISPDGKLVAFVAADTLGLNHLWVRPVSSVTATQFAGSEEARFPFWSSDSRKIAFFARGKLKCADYTGGPVLTVCDASDGRGGTWNQNGVIIFAPGPNETLFKVSASGGIATRFTQFDTTHHESSHRWPLFLPDGNHVIYTTQSAAGTASDIDVIRIATLDSSTNTVLCPGTSNVCYGAGRILYVRQGTLVAQEFDLNKLQCVGDPVPIAEQLIFASAYSRGSFSASQNGILILQTGENLLQHTGIFTFHGERRSTVQDLNPLGPRYSPDGKHIIFSVVDPISRRGDIWVHEIARGVSSRLTFSPALDISPIWSPHGDSIAFQSNRNGVYDLYAKSVNGAGGDILLVQSNRGKGVTDWSRDGRYIIYNSGGDPKTKADIWILPMFGDRKPRSFLATEFNEAFAVCSPDSRWIAYNSDETGRPEIYVRLLDGTGGKIQITTNGGRRPLWKADAKKLYFNTLDRKLAVAYVKPGVSSLTVDSIGTLFDFESRNIVGNAITDVSDDGKQVLAVVTDAKQAPAPITLVVNWNEELKKK